MKTFKQFVEDKNPRIQWASQLNKLLQKYGLRKKEKQNKCKGDCKRNYWNKSENEITMEIEADPGNPNILKITQGSKSQMINKIKQMIDDIKKEFNDTSDGHLEQLYLEKDSLGLLIGKFR